MPSNRSKAATTRNGAASSWSRTIEQVIAGEPEGIERVTKLVTRHLARIGAHRERHCWDDLVQEVLIVLITRPPSCDADAAIVGHITSTAFRRYIDELRRICGRRRAPGCRAEHRRGESDAVGWRKTVGLEAAADVVDPRSSVAAARDPGLWTALAKLEPRRRRAIGCRFLLGFTHREGAARTGIPIGTYKRLVSQGLEELRQRLAPELRTS